MTNERYATVICKVRFSLTSHPCFLHEETRAQCFDFQFYPVLEASVFCPKINPFSVALKLISVFRMCSIKKHQPLFFASTVFHPIYVEAIQSENSTVSSQQFGFKEINLFFSTTLSQIQAVVAVLAYEY